jgi:hypothetical protein
MENSYVLVCFSDESSFVAGVFTSYQLADEFSKKHKNFKENKGYDLYYEIETHTINKPKGEHNEHH